MRAGTRARKAAGNSSPARRDRSRIKVTAFPISTTVSSTYRRVPDGKADRTPATGKGLTPWRGPLIFHAIFQHEACLIYAKTKTPPGGSDDSRFFRTTHRYRRGFFRNRFRIGGTQGNGDAVPRRERPRHEMQSRDARAAVPRKPHIHEVQQGAA